MIKLLITILCIVALAAACAPNPTAPASLAQRATFTPAPTIEIVTPGPDAAYPAPADPYPAPEPRHRTPKATPIAEPGLHCLRCS